MISENRTVNVGDMNWILNWITQFTEYVGVCFIKFYFPTTKNICSKKSKNYLYTEILWKPTIWKVFEVENRNSKTVLPIYSSTPEWIIIVIV